MSHRSYTKRNRPVTACRECYRRKQKCDRLKPCNICLARNVPEKCLYGDELQKTVDGSKSKKQTSTLPTPPPDDEDESEYGTAAPDELGEQIGYSAFCNNSFLDLYRTIDAVRISTAGSLGLSTLSMRPSFKERYFKILGHLPSRSICDTLIDIYFSEADWYFIVLERYYFNRLRAAWDASDLPDETTIRLEQYPRDLQHFPALLFQVLAIGIHFAPKDSNVLELMSLQDTATMEKQSRLYSDFGCEMMNILGREKPSITGIEHDLLRMSWLKDSSRGTESWHSVGQAISQAQELELHLETEALNDSDRGHVTSEQLWYEEYRRRVWARVFLFDSNMAPVLGRPRRIHLDDCTTQWPICCDIPDSLERTTPHSPTLEEPPSSFAFVSFLIQLAEKIHDVMSVKFKRTCDKDPTKLVQVQHDVQAILESLPQTMQPLCPDTSWDVRKPHFPKLRQQILTSANAFLMRLHRPYIQTSEFSRNAVISTALIVLDAQQELFELMKVCENQHRIYGFSCYTIDGALLLCAVVLNRCPESPDLVAHISRALQQALGRLAFLRNISRVAATGEQLISQCCAKIAARWPLFMDSNAGSPFASPGTNSENNLPDLTFLDTYNLPNGQNLEFGILPDAIDPGFDLYGNVVPSIGSDFQNGQKGLEWSLPVH